ncbi:PAS domain-containing protein [Halomonas sp. TRM85114]|uniref:PAS domain-containing protein n=1 Tax=Halomonas jincaotanensis TaxID=2810616 RepID=UPI001BD4549D|nr:PAS domain-containing protein [Halomonas jincaotanensis]MBS9405686.1 PAS domain-containing protein [Halomonas jincaotanensis]
MSDNSLLISAAIFEHAPVGLAALDVEGVLVQVNTHFARLLGWRIEQVEGYRLRDLIVEPYGVYFTACLADIARGAQVESRLEIPLRRGDHDITWVNMTLVRMAESPNEGRQRLSMIAEIRECHGQPSQTLADRLMQVSPDVVYTMRPDDLATMTFVSQNMATVTGWSPQTLIGQPDWLEEHVHPEDFQRVYGDLTRWLARGALGYARFHYRQRTPEGRWQWLGDQLTTVRDSQGRIVELVGAFRDVTDQVEITQRLEMLARNVPGVLFQYRQDPDGQSHFIYASERALEILGLPHEVMEADASKAFDRVHRDDLAPFLASIEASRRHLTPWQLRLRLMHPQRGEIWVEGRASPEVEEDGSVLWHGVLLDITRQVAAEEALQQSRTELAEAQQLAHLGSWIWSVATDDLRWSDETFRIFGVPPDAFTPTFEGFLQRVHDEDRERVRAAVGEALQGSPYRIGFRIPWPDGSERVVDARGSVEFSPSEQPLRMIGTLLDVTPLRHLETNQKRLVAILEHTPDVVAMLGPEGSVWYMNPAGRRQFGFPLAVGEPWQADTGWNTWDLPPHAGTIEETILRFHPAAEAERIIREALPIALRDGVWQGETRFLDAAGEEIHASQVIIVQRDSDGAIYQASTILHDITRLRAMEAEQRLLAATFRSSQAIFITDSAGIIQRINPGFTTLLGYTSEQVVGQTLRIFHSFVQSPEFYKNIFDQIEEKGYWEGEIWNQHRSGKVIPLHEFITAIYDPGGRLEHYIATFFDISRQKELESRLEYQALYDSLTDTANRRQLEPLMEHEARRASRYGNPCALVMLDLDHFKAINDTFGHDLGDEVLRRVVVTLKERLRDSDVLGRWGGEEFIVMLPDTSGDHARQMAEQLRIRVERTEIPEVGHVTISLGVSEYHPAESIKDWIKRADDAMYAAKKTGRNRVV